MSISAWVRPTLTGRQDLVGQWLSGSNLHFLLTYALLAGKFSFYISTTGSNTNHVDSASLITLGSWYHVVATYDGANLKMYINSNLDTTIAQTGTLFASSTDNVYIGQSGDGNNSKAFIDDVIICSTAMSQADVTNLYYNGILPSNMVSRWTLDEGSGTTANDSVGSNNGTITGATYSTDVFMKARALVS